MAIEQSEAIVLRVYPWSETSCIANLYTREHGKLSLLAKGARRPKSPFEAALDLLSICRVVFISKSSDALDILTEARLERRFRAAERDLLQLHCGYYVAELLDRLTDKGDRQPEIYDLARTTLIDLDSMEFDARAVVLRFELQMLRMLGNLPTWDRCPQCGIELSVPEVSVASAPAMTVAEAAANQAQNEWRTFSSLLGGILCERCRPGARQLVRIHQSVQQILLRYSESQWQKIDINQFTREHRRAIRKVIVQYLNTLVDRKFQLHSYLEELGR